MAIVVRPRCKNKGMFVRPMLGEGSARVDGTPSRPLTAAAFQVTRFFVCVPAKRAAGSCFRFLKELRLAAALNQSPKGFPQ